MVTLPREIGTKTTTVVSNKGENDKLILPGTQSKSEYTCSSCAREKQKV